MLCLHFLWSNLAHSFPPTEVCHAQRGGEPSAATGLSPAKDSGGKCTYYIWSSRSTTYSYSGCVMCTRGHTIIVIKYTPSNPQLQNHWLKLIIQVTISKLDATRSISWLHFKSQTLVCIIYWHYWHLKYMKYLFLPETAICVIAQ